MKYPWVSSILMMMVSAAGSLGQVPSLLHPDFNNGVGANDDVFTVVRTSDAQYLIAGQFTAYNNFNRGRLARVSPMGGLDPSFFVGSGANNNIYAVAIQGDGKVLIGGAFTDVHGVGRSYLARLQPNGAVDTEFANGLVINNELRVIIVEPDGRILIAGRFTQVGGQSRNRLARLNTDGSLDGTFNPGTGANDNIRTMLRMGDGRLMIGGLFTTYDGSPRGRIARLLSSGALDLTFAPGTGADEQVRAIATNSTGQIYIGGDFEAYNGVPRSSVARLFPNGDLDPAFDQGISEGDAVRAVTVQTDGKVWIGGLFYQAGGLFRSNIARLNPDGSADDFFDPPCSMNDEVFTLDYDNGNRLLVGGKFTRVDNRTFRRLAMLDPQSQSMLFVFDYPYWGVTENEGPALFGIRRLGAFSAPASVGMATRSGTAIAGEDFVPFTGTIQFASNQRTGIAEVVVIDDPFPEGVEWLEAELINPPGIPAGDTNQTLLRFNIVDNEYQATLDETFQPEFINGPIHAIAEQPDGKIVIGGEFRYFGGCLENFLSRLTTTGSVDCTFYLHSEGANQPVHSISLQTNGAILAGGAFTYFNSQPAQYLARVMTDGYTDPSFITGPFLNGQVLATAVQADGKILIGGMFTTYGAASRTYLARLNNDGSLDGSFNPVLNADGFVRVIRVTSDGRIVIGGDFSSVNQAPRSHVARLNPNGSIDASFNSNPGPNGNVRDLLIQPNGRIVIAGEFSEVDQLGRERVARLLDGGSLDTTFRVGEMGIGTWVNSVAIQADGKIVLGGRFSHVGQVNRSCIARVEANGALDAGFFASSGANGEVNSVRVLAGGQILAAGDFTEIGGLPRRYIARLNSDPLTNRIETTSGSFSIREDFGAAGINVRRTGFSSGTASIHYETIADTAQAGTDFVAESGTITFAPLETLKTIPVPLVNDGLPEGTERFRLRLSDPSGAILGSRPETIVEILDNDSGIELEQSNVVWREDAGTLTLVVRRNSDGPETLSVDFRTVAGTAQEGIDYQGTNGALVFPPGEFTRSIDIVVNNNPEFEGHETFRLVLSNPSSGAGLGARSETLISIEDQDSTFEFGGIYPAGTERDGATLCYVNRRGLMTQAATVRVRSGNGTATPGLDYIPIDQTIAFAPGETFQYFYVTNLNDGIVEPIETIPLILSDPTGLAALGSPALTNILIIDNDQGIEFAAPNFHVNEFSAEARAFVRRGDDGTNTLTVHYFTSDESALSGFDYVGQSGTLTLPPGTNGMPAPPVPMVIPILQDKTLETNEAFRITLVASGASAALGTQTVARTVILDDERAGSLDLTFNVGPDLYPGFNGAEVRLAPHSEQKLLVGLYFVFTRLLADGSDDPGFNAENFYFWPPTALQRSDGKILIGGSSSNGFFQNGLCLRLLETNGQNIDSFSIPIQDGRTASIALQSDGRILIGGSYSMPEGVAGFRSVLRVLPAGGLDPTFDAGEFTPSTGYYFRPSTVEAVAVQPDGRIIAAGMFVTVANQPRSKIVRLNTNGSIDPTFVGPVVSGNFFTGVSPYDSYFAAIALQDDGRIVVAGSFTNIGGHTAYNLARYKADGALDLSFAPGLAPQEVVTSLALQPDGKILVAGSYYDPFLGDRSFIYRLLTNGEQDPEFNLGQPPNGTVTSLVLLRGGDIAIGGSFTEVNGIPMRLVARLKGDGLYLRAGPSTPGNVLLELFNTWPGGKTVLEGSTNLVNWVPSQTNTATAARQQWTLPSTGTGSFYRAKHTAP